MLVREGFSIWAFLLGFIWLFYNRAWAPALLTMMLAMMCYWLEKTGTLNEAITGIVQLGLQYWIGLEARDWQRDALTSRGYRFADIVIETTEERAELRYYERHLMVGGAVHQTTPDMA